MKSAKIGLTEKFLKRDILGFVIAVATFLTPLMATAQSVTLAWNASPDPTAVGYALYYGTDGVTFPNRLDVGTNTLSTVSNLVAGTTNYFQVTAYSASQIESVPTAQVQFFAQSPTTTTVHSSTGGGGTLASAAGSPRYIQTKGGRSTSGKART